MGPPSLIVGVGNALRRDDGAGIEAAKRLAARSPVATCVLVKDGNLLSLLDDWRGAGSVILIDTIRSGLPPGTIWRSDVSEEPLPAECVSSSTHAIGVAQVVELARALGRLPPRLLVFGIEGRDFGVGAGLSPEVEAAVDEVVRRVADEPTS